ncbi:MAG: hypothetical protein QME81_02480 [bacterium]|nr:hypothetical protein [bacterium]
MSPVIAFPQVLLEKLDKDVAKGFIQYGEEIEKSAVFRAKEEALFEIERKTANQVRKELQPVEDFKRTSSERLAVIETEIKNIYRLLDERFIMVEERFEKIDQRFEKIDQRFEKIDQRFEKIDQRFEKLEEQFGGQMVKINQRLDTMNEKFHQEMAGFYKQIGSQTMWIAGTMIALTGVILAAVKILFL